MWSVPSRRAQPSCSVGGAFVQPAAVRWMSFQPVAAKCVRERADDEERDEQQQRGDRDGLPRAWAAVVQCPRATSSTTPSSRARLTRSLPPQPGVEPRQHPVGEERAGEDEPPVISSSSCMA